MAITVDALFRFPVKSMAGERVDQLELDARGVAGDRGWAIVDQDGKLASGKHSRRFRRMDPLFDLAAWLERDGVPVVTDHRSVEVRADDPGADALMCEHFGVPVRLRPEADVWHMDGGSVSLVGSASLRRTGELLARGEPPVDSRRTRTNIVLATDRPFAEDEWVGRVVRLGTVRLTVVAQVPRCRMVDIAQDGLDRDGRILTSLGRTRQTNLAVYADVLQSGEISVGDAVEVEVEPYPASAISWVRRPRR